jgi:phosphoglycolate phosphatase
LRYRLVIFDSDGTLADTLPWMRRLFNELADEHGFRRVELSEYERFRDMHGLELLRELGLPLWILPRVVRSLRTRMGRHLDEFTVFQGVGDMLRQLAAAGVTLGIVSSNSRENVERILGPKNASLIDHFACGASVFGKAPRLRQILRASRVPREQAIYIGDEVRDAEAARKAGIAFGAVAWGQHRPETLRAQKPEICFSAVEEIAGKLC